MKQPVRLAVLPAARPAAFRRLCVETIWPAKQTHGAAPAAFRRLCVETVAKLRTSHARDPSRLQAAVC